MTIPPMFMCPGFEGAEFFSFCFSSRCGHEDGYRKMPFYFCNLSDRTCDYKAKRDSSGILLNILSGAVKESFIPLCMCEVQL